MLFFVSDETCFWRVNLSVKHKRLLGVYQVFDIPVFDAHKCTAVAHTKISQKKDRKKHLQDTPNQVLLKRNQSKRSFFQKIQGKTPRPFGGEILKSLETIDVLLWEYCWTIMCYYWLPCNFQRQKKIDKKVIKKREAERPGVAKVEALFFLSF